jgi:hypothetical protein
MNNQIRSKILVREFIGRHGLLTIYKNLVYFYGLEVGAYLSILIDDEKDWGDIKTYHKNDFSELPWVSLKDIEKSLFISRERNLELLKQMSDLKLISTIMDDEKEKIFFKLNQSELNNNYDAYLNMLIEEEKKNEQQA